MKKKQLTVTIAIFSLCAIGIALLAAWPSTEETPRERHRTRVIVPVLADNPGVSSGSAAQHAFDESYTLRTFLGDGEQAISVLNFDFNRNSIEEQIVVYRNQYDSESPVYIALFAFDGRGYRRLWDMPTAATVPGTVSLYMLDLLGDRSNSIVISGMNAQGEHTMTVFNHNEPDDINIHFAKIAEIQVDGSITILETERTAAYRQGIASGQPFDILAYGRDYESFNLLDKTEISYEFNEARRIFERSRVTRVPGTQIEQRRVREILSGVPRVFEDFVNDLWYLVSPDGTLDRTQYIYFDPARREIVFYGDGAQQIYSWQQSIATRYGLNISSQSISVSTLGRIINIELVSLDSIRVRVQDRIRIRIDVSESLDGLYRRGGTLSRDSAAAETAIQPFQEGIYDSSLGRLRFHPDGEYELSSGSLLTRGRYVFFQAAGSSLLELRPHAGQGENSDGRQVFLVENGSAGFTPHTLENIILSRVRLGTTGIHELQESPIIMTRAQETFN